MASLSSGSTKRKLSDGSAKLASSGVGGSAGDKIELSKEEIVHDYLLAFASRHLSLIGRKEVLTGKAKFGIFGDGKEVAQIALARHFQPGDWRSGYYRDQTWMLAAGLIDYESFFAQLYANADVEQEPASGGRQMNAHFASRYIENGNVWLDQLASPQSSADASPTACQMSRLVGLGYASKLYRELKELRKGYEKFSKKGNEIAFGSIGDASTSEGIFWESLNAAGVLQIPLVMSIWDDGYGISVPRKFQTTNDSISLAASGFEGVGKGQGWRILTVAAWDFAALLNTYKDATAIARQEHQPVLVHVKDCTQPQGHSTSGSHERYKNADRLAFEDDFDCIARMRSWMLEQGVASADELDAGEESALKEVRAAQTSAWQKFLQPQQEKKQELEELLASLDGAEDQTSAAITQLQRMTSPKRRDLLAVARRLLMHHHSLSEESKEQLSHWVSGYKVPSQALYSNYTYASLLGASERVDPAYTESSEKVDGRVVIQSCFDQILARDPRVFIIGEDVGQLGGVNLEFDGLADKHGSLRVTDTGIREATILGQGIGAAMRGLRPIVDIQYLDYLLYCLQVLSDDLATLHYRSAGGQLAPAIVRTKGHRLEGIWHTGSPMATILGSCRGVFVGVPRDMTRAAGLYNYLLSTNQPAIVIEVLNAYRNKEVLPDNLAETVLPFGEVETLRTGTDVTLLTYGACTRIAAEACEFLAQSGIEVELIDAQTLVPFDNDHAVARSVAKTNALVVLDEDVPGGASSYLLQKVLEEQNGYETLDAAPLTITAQEHRSAYGSDGDYFSKPNVEDVYEKIYALMNERDPARFNG